MIEGHGDDIYKYGRLKANFSSNVWSGKKRDDLWAHLQTCRRLIENYPEPRAYSLEAELAEKLRLQPSEVCVTNGATEAIYLLAQLFRGGHAAILQPTFTEYADACRIHGVKCISYYQWTQLPAGIEVVWICNPNNPTGTTLPKDEVLALIRRHPGVTFIFDHSYARFTQRPLLTPDEAVRYPNVCLIHSMTKEFSIPGLRLGYVTAHQDLVARLSALKMPWSVNALAVEAGHYLLRQDADWDVSALLMETQRVTDALRSMGGVDVWDTDTHFFLARLRMGTAAALKDYLAHEHGLLIRDASNFEGLDAGFFRIAVQQTASNDLLLQSIRTWLYDSCI